MAYKDVTPPAGGKISIQNGKLKLPDNSMLPFIRGHSLIAPNSPVGSIFPWRPARLG